MTAIPCGQKNNKREMIQSQMVTPPLAAIDGTTLRLKTATTKRRTRSQRPSTRRRCGVSMADAVCVVTSFDKSGFIPKASERNKNQIAAILSRGQAGAQRPFGKMPQGKAAPLHMPTDLVAGGADFGGTALLLSLRQGRGDFFENGEMLRDVGFGVLHRDGPLLVPPIGLSEHAAIHHREPIVAPEIDVDGGPVAIILDFLWIEHEGAVDSGADDVGLEADFGDDFAIAVGELFAELVGVSVIFAREDFAERCEARGHGYAIRVVSAAVEDLMLRDEVHDFAARAECAERKSAADRFRKADHVGFDAEIFTGAAPGKLRAGFYFVEDQQRAVFVAEVAETLQESRLRNAQADVHQNRLKDDGRDLAGVFSEAAFDAAEIVEAGNDDVGDRRFRNAAATGDGIRRIGIAVLFSLGLHADERSIVKAVV